MSILDDIGSEPAEGGGTGDSSPQNKEIEGLRAALQAERNKRQSSESKIAELTAKVDALAKPAKEYTRSELQSFVDDGRMSQGEADRILDEQMRRSIAQDVTKSVKDDQAQTALAARINDEIGKYTEFYPDILSDGSENRRLVAEEYRRQISLGKPDNIQTELDALTAVFGPSTRLSKGREKELETHQDVGSDGGGEAKKSDAPKLPSHVKEHYEKLIGMGAYKGWDDPNLKKEVEEYGGRWG